MTAKVGHPPSQSELKASKAYVDKLARYNSLKDNQKAVGILASLSSTPQLEKAKTAVAADALTNRARPPEALASAPSPAAPLLPAGDARKPAPVAAAQRRRSRRSGGAAAAQRRRSSRCTAAAAGSQPAAATAAAAAAAAAGVRASVLWCVWQSSIQYVLCCGADLRACALAPLPARARRCLLRTVTDGTQQASSLRQIF